jgi:hypothetical protein
MTAADVVYEARPLGRRPRGPAWVRVFVGHTGDHMSREAVADNGATGSFAGCVQEGADRVHAWLTAARSTHTR